MHLLDGVDFCLLGLAFNRKVMAGLHIHPEPRRRAEDLARRSAVSDVIGVVSCTRRSMRVRGHVQLLGKGVRPGGLVRRGSTL
ncbi:hypothetical protein MESS2_1270057 [Mesorhizobium metallidurans STM 2683]|uniref:Uncharacterized protein n=1 Tax=Mesorhizobium metallidurans STM 2683 TaxID=1297569 RepID=M5EJ48_9HYPH|nr:hypothetical protein MESS2_1270057 [Mesorhizobium metallidurans STM 2683]